MSGNFRLIAKVQLDSSHTPTGNTQHWVGGKNAEVPNALEIKQYADDDGFYLLYLNNLGEEITDTFHESFEGAQEQANFEFSVQPREWIKSEDSK